jgi:hypothetical protein
LRRARLYAAGSAATSVIATTTSPTQSVFVANVRNSVPSNRNETCSPVGSRLNTNGLFSLL